MRISDWSSDVCSSDLKAVRERDVHRHFLELHPVAVEARLLRHHLDPDILFGLEVDDHAVRIELARADAREDIVRHRLELDQHFRSEEHTSELQSLMRISYAVFCLKKKKQTK